MADQRSYYTDVVNQLLADYKAGLEPHRASGNLLAQLSSNVIQDGTKFEF